MQSRTRPPCAAASAPGTSPSSRSGSRQLPHRTQNTHSTEPQPQPPHLHDTYNPHTMSARTGTSHGPSSRASFESKPLSRPASRHQTPSGGQQRLLDSSSHNRPCSRLSGVPEDHIIIPAAAADTVQQLLCSIPEGHKGSNANSSSSRIDARPCSRSLPPPSSSSGRRNTGNRGAAAPGSSETSRQACSNPLYSSQGDCGMSQPSSSAAEEHAYGSPRRGGGVKAGAAGGNGPAEAAAATTSSYASAVNREGSNSNANSSNSRRTSSSRPSSSGRYQGGYAGQHGRNTSSSSTGGSGGGGGGGSSSYAATAGGGRGSSSNGGAGGAAGPGNTGSVSTPRKRPDSQINTPVLSCLDRVTATEGGHKEQMQQAAVPATPLDSIGTAIGGTGRGAGAVTDQQRPKSRSCTAAAAGGEGCIPAAAAARAKRPGTYSVGVPCGSSPLHVLRPGALTQDPGPPPGGYSRSCSRAAARNTGQQQPQQQQLFQPPPQAQQQQEQGLVCPSPCSSNIPDDHDRRGHGASAEGNRPFWGSEQGEATGPLLSDYFRPASAVAPGSCSLCGLPGMDPPQGFQVPSVKLPVNLSSSWDAGGSGNILTTVTTSGAGDWFQGRGDTGGQEGEFEAAAGQGEGVGRLNGDCIDGAVGGGEGGLDAGSVWQQPSLVWSAVHEVDGRPATRSGGPRSR